MAINNNEARRRAERVRRPRDRDSRAARGQRRAGPNDDLRGTVDDGRRVRLAVQSEDCGGGDGARVERGGDTVDDDDGAGGAGGEAVYSAANREHAAGGEGCPGANDEFGRAAYHCRGDGLAVDGEERGACNHGVAGSRAKGLGRTVHNGNGA